MARSLRSSPFLLSNFLPSLSRSPALHLAPFSPSFFFQTSNTNFNSSSTGNFCVRFCHTDIKTNVEQSEEEERQKVITRRKIKELKKRADKILGKGDTSKAEDSYSTIISLYEELKLPNDALLVEVYSNLAYCQQQEGKENLEETHKSYVAAEKMLDEVLGREGQEFGVLALNFAEVLSSLGKLEQAQAKISEALVHIKHHYGPDSELLGLGYSNLGGYLCAQGKFSEAIPFVAQGVDILEAQLGPDNQFTVSAVTNYLRARKKKENRMEEYQTVKEKFSSLDSVTKENYDWIDVEHSEEKMKECTEEWAQEGTKLRFDAPGLLKSKQYHKAQLKLFIEELEKTSGRKLDESELEVILQEFSSLGDRDFKTYLERAQVLAEAAQYGDEQNDKIEAIVSQVSAFSEQQKKQGLPHEYQHYEFDWVDGKPVATKLTDPGIAAERIFDKYFPKEGDTRS